MTSPTALREDYGSDTVAIPYSYRPIEVNRKESVYRVKDI